VAGKRSAAPSAPPARAQPQPAETPARRAASSVGRTRLRVTLALALALVAAGLGAAEAATLLQRALRTPTADDIAQRICTAYERQDYDLLLSQIDPTPIPPAVPGPFDAGAKAALVGELRAEDGSAGPVTQCSYKVLVVNAPAPPADQRQYFFSMQRGVLYTSLMTLARQHDDTWLIQRDSNFLGAPAGG
jgi:hypothetical protein